MKRSARITIHPDALQHNLKRAKEIAPNSKVNAVIKANAYGHGAIETAGILYEITDGFAVSCIPEAVELRQSGIDKPLTVLQGHQSINDLRIAEAYKLRLTIHEDRQLSLLNQFSPAKNGFHFDLNVKIDSGMHRLGFDPSRCHDIYSKLKNHIYVNPENIILMTHLSCADEIDNDFTSQQLSTFDRACKKISAPKSIANSAGILGWQESHADWIRPGIMLFGSSPFTSSNRDTHKLKASMTFNAPVIAIHKLSKGDSIGYGATWTCPKNLKVAVIACGYADGYPRHASSGSPVWLNGQEVKLVGRVSMDMIIVELDGFNENQDNRLQIGDLAELWGENINIDQVAQSADTISYELLCNAGNLCDKMGN